MEKNTVRFPPVAEHKVTFKAGKKQDLLGEGILKLEGAEFIHKGR